MNLNTIGGVEIRPAAKAVLRVGDDKILVVEGESGRANLPGGGRDMYERDGHMHYEDPVTALIRELEEETGVTEAQVTNLAIRTSVRGLVGREGELQFLADWTVLEGGLQIPVDEMVIPKDSEIRCLYALTPDQFVSHRKPSQLGIRALMQMGYLQK